MEQLTKSLADGPDGTVAITVIRGQGGVGKSWLAAQWANRNMQRFPDGQLYVNLHGFDPRTPPLPSHVALRGFLEALGVARDRVPTDLRAQSALYRSLLADRRMLILLDDVRHADQVRPLLPGSPSCSVVVTSRNRLTALIAAHGARLMPLDVLSPAEAHALLAGRLGAERTSAEPGAVAALVEHCAGLPLALGIVAARAAMHPDFRLAVLADDLVRAADRLTALDPGDLTVNVRAVFAASHRALTPSADRLFSFLGLAQGPDIGLAAAAGLAGLPQARTRVLLAELEGAHIVRQHRPGRYRMHDLVRLYAAELADGIPSQEPVAAQARLLDHYLHSAFAANRLLDGPYTPFRPEPDAPATDSRPVAPDDTAAALQWFHDEHECLLAAQSQAAALGRHRLVWQLAWTLISYHLGGHRLQEYVNVWQAALAAAEHDGDNPTAETLAHWRLGFASARAGDHAQALEHLHHALTLAERTGDIAGQAHIYRTLGRVWEEQGDNARALDHAMHALRLYQKVNHPFWQANQLNAVGWLHAKLGFYAQARTHCERALALLRAGGLPAHGASTLDSLGYIAHHTGRYRDALDHYGQALELFREVGDTANEADTLANAGETHRALHHYADARNAWQRALELYRSQNRTAEAEGLRDRLETLRDEWTTDVRAGPGVTRQAPRGTGQGLPRPCPGTPASPSPAPTPGGRSEPGAAAAVADPDVELGDVAEASAGASAARGDGLHIAVVVDLRVHAGGSPAHREVAVVQPATLRVVVLAHVGGAASGCAHGLAAAGCVGRTRHDHETGGRGTGGHQHGKRSLHGVSLLDAVATRRARAVRLRRKPQWGPGRGETLRQP
ncbi:ATP-binding protein [Streptomyces sp. CA-251387]|uniref:ATP-binding protein n=1 Tax=Streptomyces sp. CA-251387 TaxID=3240064 RepID=UPI003D924E0F